MTDIPILGARPAPAAATAREYVAELHMVSGAVHRIAFNFQTPADGNGIPRLDALKDFDPEKQTVANITNMIGLSHGDPIAMRANRITAPITVPAVTDGVHVVWRYVESFRYLGPADELSVLEGLQDSAMAELRAARAARWK